MTAPNVTTGSIPDGEAAVLFDDQVFTTQQMQDAWDPGGFLGTNFIPVSDFSALTNGSGDSIGLWEDEDGNGTEYAADRAADTFTNAEASQTYENNTNGFPDDDGNGSIYLIDLGLDPTGGASWALSEALDGIGSFSATEVTGTVEIHAGGDVGSPGTFDTQTATSSADFDSDGDVDGDDFLAWQAGFNTGTTAAEGDADNDGDVDADDFATWASNFGTTGSGSLGTSSGVPEPSTIALLITLCSGILACRCR